MDLEFAHYLQFFFALVFVIGLIGLVTLVMRHYGLGGAIKLNARSVSYTHLTLPTICSV